MCICQYYVHQKTLTQADVFAAVGLARLLDSSTIRARIRSEGSCFVIEAMDVGDNVLGAIHPQELYCYVCVHGNRPENLLPFDLKTARDTEQQRRRLEQQIRRNPELARDQRVIELLNQLTTGPEFLLYDVFERMQAHKGANRALENINMRVHHDRWRDILERLRNPCVQNLPDVRLGATGNQLINPLSAKGTHHPIPAGTTRRNPSLQELGDNEILQYLRYGGYFVVALPHRARSGDIKLFTPIPGDISLRALRSLVIDLRNIIISRLGSRLKIDALVVLDLTKLLIRYSEPYAQSQDERYKGLSLQGRTPARVISGIYVTHYTPTSAFGKNVSEISILGLPNWIQINSREDAEFWLEALEENKRVVNELDESRSEGIDLLQKYRKIFQSRGGDVLIDFLNFAGCYATYWMSVMSVANRGSRLLSRFSTDVLERMVERMSEEIASILNDEGFRSVACAIRRATVSAQARKVHTGDSPREIRYGLINDILRKRFVKEELIEELSVFIASYNAENARIREINQSMRAAPPNVTTDEMESVMRIIDQTNDPALVGALLAAYGTCREPHEPTD